MMTIRGDALPKLTGRARFVGDVTMAGMCFAAVTRSYAAHAKITRIDTAAARALPGVLAVVTAADVTPSLYGRRVKDVPILAREQVRFVGERVAAVVAETRELAEEAAALIDVEYEDLPAVFDADEALRDGSPLVHQEPERYENAQDLVAREPNLQSLVAVGSSEQVDLLLQSSAFSIEREYRTPSGHQGYIEPHGCVCSVESDGTVHVWATNKSPYQLREQVAACLELPVSKVVVEPVFIGGDFGGKGSPMDVPLCVELARITGRPVKLTLRYVEDLIAANPRHASRTRVRVGCSADGKLTGLSLDSVLNGGAYAGFKPRAAVEHRVKAQAGQLAVGRAAHAHLRPGGMAGVGRDQILDIAKCQLHRTPGDAGELNAQRNVHRRALAAEVATDEHRLDDHLADG